MYKTLSIALLGLSLFAAEQSAAQVCQVQHDHRSHGQQGYGFPVRYDYEAGGYDREYRGEGRFRDERRFASGFDRCIDFVAAQLSQSWSGNYALRRARKFCDDDFDVRLFRFAFKQMPDFSANYRLKQAKRFAKRNTHIRGRLELFRTIFQSYSQFSSDYALKRAARDLKRYPNASPRCVERALRYTQQTWGQSNYAYQRAMRECNNEQRQRRRRGRSGRGRW